jgi:hypothetical protein
MKVASDGEKKQQKGTAFSLQTVLKEESHSLDL